LAGEIITDEPAPEGYKNAAMEKGNALEAEARDSYARRRKVEVRQVGFVRNFSGLKACGASPDGFVGFDGGLEIKIVTTHCAIGKPRMIDVQGSVSWHVRPSKDAPHRTGW